GTTYGGSAKNNLTIFVDNLPEQMHNGWQMSKLGLWSPAIPVWVISSIERASGERRMEGVRRTTSRSLSTTCRNKCTT
ncbi:hypothetical protein U1Q18_009284, partial [Sarracenia purpurea var. burkii]